MSPVFRLSMLLIFFTSVECPGLLILYRPYDVSNDCAFSGRLRYDLTFGMGMSDTITLVFRTLNSADYECLVEIVADTKDVFLVIVILFPGTINNNCLHNPNAFAVLKNSACFNLCDTVYGIRNEYSHYFVASVPERFRFRFASNSSINADINAHMYQVTATVARMKPENQTHCFIKNETICTVADEDYCFTSGVVCDGIKNCGVENWYDERTTECGLPVERLAVGPVFAVVAVMLCAATAAAHVLMRCLPPLANSFFVFNANEDNRLCMDSVFIPPDEGPIDVEKVHRPSIVPVSSSSSSDNRPSETSDLLKTIAVEKERTSPENEQDQPKRRSTNVRSVTTKLQQKFRAMTNRSKAALPVPSRVNLPRGKAASPVPSRVNLPRGKAASPGPSRVNLPRGKAASPGPSRVNLPRVKAASPGPSLVNLPLNFSNV